MIYRYAISLVLGEVLFFSWLKIEMVISTFLGFLSALFVEAIVATMNKKNTTKQLIKDIVKELENIQNIILTLEKKQLYIQPYSTPIWHGACASGTILCLDKKKCYSTILQVFASIYESNLIEMKCFELFVSNTDAMNISLLSEIVNTNRTQLLNQVNKAIEIIKE